MFRSSVRLLPLGIADRITSMRWFPHVGYLRDRMLNVAQLPQLSQLLGLALRVVIAKASTHVSLVT